MAGPAQHASPPVGYKANPGMDVGGAQRDHSDTNSTVPTSTTRTDHDNAGCYTSMLTSLATMCSPSSRSNRNDKLDSETDTDTPMYKEVRELSKHEQLAGMGNHLNLIRNGKPVDGIPYTVTINLEFDRTNMPSTASIEARVLELGTAWEHLQCVQIDHHTSKPKLALLKKNWTADTVVREDYLPSDIFNDPSEFMTHELTRFGTQIEQGGPLWQVSIVRPLSDDNHDCKETKSCIVAVTISHILMDGTGLLRLTEALFSNTPLEYEPGLAPRMEDYTDIKPSLTMAAPMAIDELAIKPALALLPKWVSKLGGAPVWPGNAMLDHPLDCPSRSTVLGLSISSQDLVELKRIGKAHGIRTLHPILQTLATDSLWHEAGQPSAMKGLTPQRQRASEGSTAAYHATGVSITSPEVVLKYIKSAGFWDEARKLDNELHDKRVLERGRTLVGMLGYIDEKPSKSAKAEGLVSGMQEYYCRDVLGRDAPYIVSIAVSNLGATRLPSGCTDLYWGQSAYPFEQPVVFSMIGHDGGLRVTAAFRDGCVLTREQTESIGRRMEQSFHTIIQTEATGGYEAGEAITLGDLE